MTTSLSVGSGDVLGAAHAAGVLDGLDVQFAGMLARRSGSSDPGLLTAAALAAKAVRLEHVCVALDDESVRALWRGDDDECGLEAPTASSLHDALVAASDLVEVVDEGVEIDEHAGPPLVVCGPRLYLRRYAILEQRVAARLLGSAPVRTPEGLDAALASLAHRLDDRQHAAVRNALTSSVSVVAGGPGTGKTTAIAAMVEVALGLPSPLTVALAAPTGKAASRLNEAVAAAHDATGDVEVPSARTIHSLLGIGRDGFARGGRTVEVDLLVVDEASMVSLPLLAQLFDATGLQSRVVLVGDPDQLASIEVGAVLADVVAAAPREPLVVVTTLTTAHRFADGTDVASLADAIGTGHPDTVLEVLGSRGTRVHRPDGGSLAEVVDRVVDHAEELVVAARSGDARRALELVGSLGVLCGTRRGRGSTQWWRTTIESRLVGRGVLRPRDLDYVGRPLLVTRNDPLTELSNGMTGVVVSRDGERRAVFEAGEFAESAVPWAETAWALTIHKAQGSEYDEVVVSLPGPASRVLTRELLYTAATRAKRTVTLVAPEGSLEAALARRVSRSSGLVARLGAIER